ncbi:hypothetical protein I7I50_04144 [Histoplasma capsulatum G186AR]|uniref:Uncharacterized protein n=1 Tax=Ajellomyces capsulatus TaxID=5037 RepID=A0A8H8CXI8_AJECA|nr:hypothetical protein I7I52_05052 [Histoplasma capsulatum]QSS75112.1 hypothetical protein I7I50_04144 [Histoplasma capsulatum G186AR]
MMMRMNDFPLPLQRYSTAQRVLGRSLKGGRRPARATATRASYAVDMRVESADIEPLWVHTAGDGIGGLSRFVLKGCLFLSYLMRL